MKSNFVHSVLSGIMYSSACASACKFSLKIPKLILLCVLLCNAMYSPADGAGTESEINRYALLIGVSSYQNDGLVELPGAEPDVSELSRVLVTGGFPTGNIALMTNRSGARDPRLLPTAKNIRKQLQKLIRDKKPQDTIVIGLAGHGLQAADGQTFFCPADAQLSEARSLVALQEIYDALETCNSEFKVLLIDACRENVQLNFEVASSSSEKQSGNFASSTVQQNIPEPPANTAVFLSCSPGQVAYERQQMHMVNGVFFHAVSRGLDGAAAGPDGLVTLPDLERFVKKDVESFVSKTYAATQQPVMRNNTPGLQPLLAKSDVGRKIKRANELWIRSAKKEAAAIIDEILSVNPNNALALAERSRVLSEQAESQSDPALLEESLQLAEKAVQLAPQEPSAFLARCNAHRIAGNYPAALEDCNRVIEIQRDDALAFVYRAVVYKSMENDAFMRTDLETILELNDNNPLVLSVAAGLLFAISEMEKGFELLERGIALYPDVPMLHFVKAYGHDQMGEHNKAILAYTAAIRLDDQDDEILLRRAVSLARVGDYPAAREDVDRASKINPKRSDLATVREFVSQKRTPAYNQSVDKRPTRPTAQTPTQRFAQ